MFDHLDFQVRITIPLVLALIGALHLGIAAAFSQVTQVPDVISSNYNSVSPPEAGWGLKSLERTPTRER